MNDSRQFHLAGFILALCLLASPPVARGQNGRIPDTLPPIAELIERLDAEVFAARQQAVADLLTRRDLTLDAAEWMLTEPDLSPEQRLRLERVALELFARGPRAAVGIRFPPEGDNGVRIQEVLRGFPASDVLRASDQIIEADGLRITRQATFRAAILSHAPGETMRMKLVREGDTIEVGVPLGSFGNLASAAPPRPGDLLAAWTLRRARDQAPLTADPISPVALPTPHQPPLAEPGTRAWELAFATPDAPRGLRVGGQSRESIDRSLAQLAAMDASRALTLEDLQTGGEADLAVQIVLLRNRREMLRGDEDRFTDLINGRNLDAGGRAMMRRRLTDVRQKLVIIEEQIRMLDEARGAKP